MEAGKPVEKYKSKAARVLSWMGEHVAGTVLGFAVTAVLTAGLVWVSGKDKTEGQRIDQVRQEITESGLDIRHFQEVALHAGATSYLLTVGRPGELEPDEIRIYDAEGESLHQRFSFVPEIHSQDSDVVASPETFEVLAQRDVDGDGQPELIGSYALESANFFLRMPVSIAWNPSRREYALQPLLAEDPEPKPGENEMAREELAPFESPYTITSEDGERFEAWVVESLALLEEPLFYARGEPFYLGGSYPSPKQRYGQALSDKSLQIAYWSIAVLPSEIAPQTTRLCLDGNRRLVEAGVDGGESEEDVIARVWSNLVRSDELARRGEATGDPAYVGFVFDGNCMYGE